MRPHLYLHRVFSTLVFSAALVGLKLAVPAQGTAFTYQGQLSTNGVPAGGTNDFIFAVMTAASGGSQIGSAVVVDDLPVSNGLFTVSLNVGSGGFVFDGSPRWLQISVRPGSSGGGYTALSPRQPITATPYAITASNLSGTLPATQLTGTVPSTSLQGSYIFPVTFNSSGNSFTGNGSGLVNLNPASILWGSCPPWSVCGNLGTIDGINFLGTTDNRPLDFRVFNTRALRIQQNGAATPSLIGGFSGNSVPAGIVGAAIGGGGVAGFPNRVTDTYSAVAGGLGNAVFKNDSFIGAGIANTVSAERSVLGGGRDNNIQTNASNAFLGGGWNNIIQPDSHEATIGGGSFNTVKGFSSVVAGGTRNSIGNEFGSNPYSVIGGGLSNRITDTFGGVDSGSSTIAGGRNNLIDFEADWSTIGGGVDNRISRSFSATIGGGSGNRMSDQSEGATIGGGGGNRIMRDGVISTISGGGDNLIGFGARDSTIAGGEFNVIGTPVPFGLLHGATISGGSSNNIGDASDYSTIAGGNLNVINSNATFATISGGNLNMVFGTNSTVGGGYSNTVNAINSTIGGGIQNRIYDLISPEGSQLNTISGGGSNWIQSTAFGAEAFANTIGGGTANAMGHRVRHNTIGGGGENGIASDSRSSTIGGGYQNFLDGDSGSIVGGNGNRILAYAEYAGSIGGGNDNLIEDCALATIGGGYTNSVIGAAYSTIAGGSLNRISGANYASIPGGYQAKASNYGQLAYASGQFAAVGDAQTAMYVCRGTSTSAALVDLFLDGSSERLEIPANSTWTYDILVTGRTTGGSSAGYQIRGVIENNAGTTAMVGSPTLSVLGEDVGAWTVTATADNANDALTVQVTGAAATTIRWVATVRTVEVTY